jgi:cobalt-zinc-cadmium efflux system membrane fusion protein
MKIRSPLVLLLPILCAAACDRPTHDPHPMEAREEPSAAATRDAEPPPAGIVTIDPEMLRDLRITTAPAEARVGGEVVTVLGEVGVNEDAYAEVGTTIPARVVRVLASPGDRAEAGQPLALLESPELGKARAGYTAARARARLAHSVLERKRGLAAERIIAGRELHEAEAEAATADGELRAARGALSALGVGEDESQSGGSVDPLFTLRSPLAGIVLERRIVQGQMTAPGSSLFRVGDLTRLWLTVHAFERDAVRVEPGANARITFSALPGRSISGTVTLVGSQVDTSSRTIPIRVEVENPDGTLRPGMSATAWIALGDAGQTIVAVPAAALQRTQEGWSVFIPREEAAFEVRAVGRGRDLGGEVEVLSGLEPGELVVVDGAFLLKAESEKTRGDAGHHDH